MESVNLSAQDVEFIQLTVMITKQEKTGNSKKKLNALGQAPRPTQIITSMETSTKIVWAERESR